MSNRKKDYMTSFTILLLRWAMKCLTLFTGASCQNKYTCGFARQRRDPRCSLWRHSHRPFQICTCKTTAFAGVWTVNCHAGCMQHQSGNEWHLLHCKSRLRCSQGMYSDYFCQNSSNNFVHSRHYLDSARLCLTHWSKQVGAAERTDLLITEKISNRACIGVLTCRPYSRSPRIGWPMCARWRRICTYGFLAMLFIVKGRAIFAIIPILRKIVYRTLIEGLCEVYKHMIFRATVPFNVVRFGWGTRTSKTCLMCPPCLWHGFNQGHMPTNDAICRTHIIHFCSLTSCVCSYEIGTSDELMKGAEDCCTLT